MTAGAVDTGWRSIARRHRGSILWMLAVVAVYIVAVAPQRIGREGAVNRAMQLAINAWDGRWDLGPIIPTYDFVLRDGLFFQPISPLPIVPYLLFVPIPALWNHAFWIIPTVLGIVASWLALPLARRYGPGGTTPYWIAAFAAFGTLLFTQAAHANFYYLAHVEAVLATFVALIEWGGRRRPWVVGLALGIAGLARPTVLLAVLPFAVAIAVREGGPWADWRSRLTWRPVAAFLAPVVFTLLITGWYDWVRFGSPFETGYGISVVGGILAERRDQGLFSLRHLPENLGLLLAGGFDLRGRFPYLVPDVNGHALMLTSPALLIAVGAGLRDRLPRLLWACAILIAIPVVTYYGFGGRETYGYRYALDAIPFLIPLVAVAARSHFAALEKTLIVLSIAFVSYGVVWIVFRYA